VKLSCQDDPDAKLTLLNPNPSAPLGTLDGIRFAPGSQLILEVSPGREPALSVGIDLKLVTDFVKPEGITVPFPGNPLTWRAQLPEGRRKLKLTSGERGLVLVVIPARGKAGKLFPENLDFPITSMELPEEALEGLPASPLSETASLSYPDHPTVPAVIIENDEAAELDWLSQARLTRLGFDAEKSALRARFEGIVEQATGRAGSFTRDHRLTLYHTFRYSWRWGLIAVTAAWFISTSWAAFGAWKKLQE
jgi:hypothetical protein